MPLARPAAYDCTGMWPTCCCGPHADRADRVDQVVVATALGVRSPAAARGRRQQATQAATASPPARARRRVGRGQWSPLVPAGPVISSAGRGQPLPQEQSVNESHSAAMTATSVWRIWVSWSILASISATLAWAR